jgi:NAD(P)-dependent dehydrogenase (short-subunit alcohol dehydrogenase family)
VQEERQEFMNKVWLVTGSASGLGRNIAEAVLESGDRLVATARDTKRLDDLVKNTVTAFARFFWT